MCILVGLDGSSQSFRALEFALEEGKLRGKKVVAIHSLYGGDRTDEEEIIRGEEILKRAEEMAREYGVEFETHLLVRGKSPGEDIVDFANEVGAEMIVLGMKRRASIKERILGGVSRFVVNHADQPVVLIK